MSNAIANALRIAAAKTERNPTDAQKEAGNYAKGKVRLHGMDIAIENPKGGERSGVGRDGKRWSVKMPAHYGYVLGTEGRDGDHVDVYVGPEPSARKVFVVDQVDAENGKFDEHKAMLGYPSKGAALADYERAFSDGKAKDRIGAVTELSVDDFRSWCRSGSTKKPLGGNPGYATGGAVMPLIKSDKKSAVSSNIKAELAAGKPRDQAIAIALDVARRSRAKKADGGEVRDWRSDMDAPAPGYDPVTGRTDGVRASATLREPRRGEDPTAPTVDKILNAILDYGPLPAKATVDQFSRTGDSIVEAVMDPSIASVTNAGLNTALTFGQPLRAAKILGAGFGASAASDLGMSPFASAKAEDDGLSDGDRKRLAALRKKGSLSRAERSDLEALNQRVSNAAAERAAAARSRAEFMAGAEAEAMKRKSQLEAQKEADRQAEYNRAVSTADRVLAEEKANRPKKFSDTAVGQLYDKAGVAAPGLLALGAGALTRSAASLAGKEAGMMAPAIMGTKVGVGAAHWPLAHSLLFEPAANPERRAYEGYARELPPDHPRKEEWQSYARGLPEKNPERQFASEEFYDPIKFAERSGLGLIEGVTGGMLGAKAAQFMANAPRAGLKAVAETPGRMAEDFHRARGKALATSRDADELRLLQSGEQGDALQSALSVAEARRRSGAQKAGSGQAAEGSPPRLSPPGEFATNPRSSSPPKSKPKTSESSAKPQDKTKRLPSLPSQKDTDSVEKALRALGSTADGSPSSIWVPSRPPKAEPTVIVKTPRKGGGWYTRNEDGKFRGGRVVEKPRSGPSPTEHGLEIARRYANGGVVVGPVVGATGGRADELPVEVPSGSFVIPADIVSGLGQGNTLAGMNKLQETFGQAKASGGAKPVAIKISDGEFVLTPEQVAQIGGGDMETGHKILDQLVVKLRQQIVNHMASLPPPSK